MADDIPDDIADTPPEPIAEESQEDALPALEDVRGWLNQIKAATLLTLLKDPDFAPAVNRAFSGFRPTAKNYALPLVRSALAQAARKDVKFAEKLQALAALSVLTDAPISPAGPIFPAVPPVSLPSSPAEIKPDKSEALRAERDQRRRERDEARQALSLAQAERDEALRARRKAETERDEALRHSKKQGERIARLERQTSKQQQTEARLVRALNRDKVSPPPAAAPRSSGPDMAAQEDKPSPWLTAVQRWLDKSKYDHTLALALEVLKSEPEDVSALEIAARSWEGRREHTQAMPYLRRLLAVQAAGRSGAAETLSRLLRTAADPAAIEADVRLYLGSLSAADTAAVEAGRKMLARLRGSDPAAHAWLAGVIAGQTTLGPVLMPPPGALGPDDALPLRLGPLQTVTARLLSDWVDQGREALVEATRTALAALETTDAETHGRVWAALEQASADDLSRLVPLRRAPRGPVVVDGSNVAWFDQESLAQGRPRLRHLREMRRTLRMRGLFPVVLYADANLPYFIDEPAPLKLMQGRQELTLVDAGTVADEVLLRTARHLGAPLVTNDKMEDWDPDGEVRKARYAFSSGGEALLLAEI